MSAHFDALRADAPAPTAGERDWMVRRRWHRTAHRIRVPVLWEHVPAPEVRRAGVGIDAYLRHARQMTYCRDGTWELLTLSPPSPPATCITRSASPCRWRY